MRASMRRSGMSHIVATTTYNPIAIHGLTYASGSDREATIDSLPFASPPSAAPSRESGPWCATSARCKISDAIAHMNSTTP